MNEQLPVVVGLTIPDAKPGEQAMEEIARFATIEEAETFLATSATIDPDRLDAGDYSIDAPEELVNPPKRRRFSALVTCTTELEVAVYATNAAEARQQIASGEFAHEWLHDGGLCGSERFHDVEIIPESFGEDIGVRATFEDGKRA